MHMAEQSIKNNFKPEQINIQASQLPNQPVLPYAMLQPTYTQFTYGSPHFNCN